ncbi:hypothetical protein SDC9_67595 [bioreactor metagenome]|uniref:Uncharacterized protein n=1 Tax=bioreactor metagenome TaxID=1076179 RepID=A0A644XY09_9ZZZZ
MGDELDRDPAVRQADPLDHAAVELDRGGGRVHAGHQRGGVRGPAGGALAGEERQHQRRRLGRFGEQGPAEQRLGGQGEGVGGPAEGATDIIDGAAEQRAAPVDPVAPQPGRHLVQRAGNHHPQRARGGGGGADGPVVGRPGADAGPQPVGDRGEPQRALQGRPAGVQPVVGGLQRLVGVADGGQVPGGDPAQREHLRVPLAGAPVEQPAPRRRRGRDRRAAEQVEVQVLTERHPTVDLVERARVGGGEPAQPGRQVGGVQPYARTLMDRVLVDQPAQFIDLLGRPGVGVGDAGGQREALPVDPDQRRGEAVQCHALDPALEVLGGEAVDDLDHLGQHLVGVDDAGPVGAAGEGVRHLDPLPGRSAVRVVDRATTRGGPDVHGQDERVDGPAELDLEDAPGHPASGGSCGPRPRHGPSGRGRPVCRDPRRCVRSARTVGAVVCGSASYGAYDPGPPGARPGEPVPPGPLVRQPSPSVDAAEAGPGVRIPPLAVVGGRTAVNGWSCWWFRPSSCRWTASAGARRAPATGRAGCAGRWRP